MPSFEDPGLYQQHYIDKSDERRNLFQVISNSFQPDSGLYPGSFVHVTPSFYIPKMTYIDSDRRIDKFFTDKTVRQYVNIEKVYLEDTVISWMQEDYSQQLPISEDTFDILFSFYAGFISQYCKKYLKNNGILVCNNSHGDDSIAFTDKDYSLIAVIKKNGDNFSITDADLDKYFKKKDGSKIDTDKVLRRMIGEKFTTTGYAYIFRKTGTDQKTDTYESELRQIQEDSKEKDRP